MILSDWSEFMSHTTPFSELSAAFRMCEAQLKAAFRHEGSTRVHAALFRKSDELLSRIDRHVPSSRNEVDEMLDFFARRRVDGTIGASEAFDRVAELLALREELPRLDAPIFRLRPLDWSTPVARDIDDLARFVTRSSARLAAIGADKRYLAVSSAAAAFNHTTPGKMLGKHVMEVIGCGHRQYRERQRLELAMAGRPQDYTYLERNGSGGPRNVRVRIRRVESAAGIPYATLWSAVDVEPGEA